MLASPTTVETLSDLFDKIRRDQRSDLLMERSGDSFRLIDSDTFADRVIRCANVLADYDVGRGDRVGLICSNRPDWHVVDFACHLRGAILVPIFATLTAPQTRLIFADAGCSVVFAEGAEQLAKVTSVRDELPRLREIVFVSTQESPEADAPELSALLAAAADADAHPRAEGGDAVATLIYTSGTTGEPKGVMLTHGNLASNVLAVLEVISCGPEDRTLSVLPLCHVFERTVSYTFLYAGAQIAYGSPQRLAEEYLMVRPTVVAGVPRLFERFQSAVVEKAEAAGGLKKRLFHWAVAAGRRKAENELNGAPFGFGARLAHAVADRLVLSKIRAATGGRIDHFVSGGAALDPSLNWWFESVGLRTLQGYGLTETSPVIAVGAHDENRVGTVGRPVPGVEVKIAPDGEILTRGPHVMKGYWNKPEATAEAIFDGWFHTGDIGSLDDDGYLRVTDRKKHLLVLSTGKNVPPQPLENALAQCRYVEQLTVIGDGRPFIAALIVPDFAVLAGWAAERGKSTDRAALCADVDVESLLRSEIDKLQVDFAAFERVRSFRLIDKPLSIEDGTLTPTLKAVRAKVEAKYAALIDEIYADTR